MISSFLGGSTAPIVSTLVLVDQTVDYNPATGVGDVTFTNYSAGSCIGAVFSPAKGTVVTASGASHLVASSNANRIDVIDTALTNPQKNIGSFAISAVFLRQ